MIYEYKLDEERPDCGTVLFKGFGVIMLILSNTANGLLITASKVDGRLPYNTFVIMILVEIAKMLFSAVFQIHSGNSILQWPNALYAIPALVYMVCDNLGFFLLTLLDPATLNVLWNAKVVWTALLLYLCLERSISRTQWAALALLTTSLVVCEIPHINEVGDATARPQEATPFVWGLILTVVGTFLVSGGNVTCEFLMKRDKDETLFWQNFQLYLFGILFNMGGVIIQMIFGSAEEKGGLFHGMGWLSVAIIFSQSFAGMCFGAVIKYLDNVAVIYCNAVSLFLVTILGRLLFGFEVSGWFVAGIVLCSFSLKLYYSRAQLGALAEEDKQRYAPVPGLVDLEDDELAGLGFEEGELDIDIDDLDDVIAGLNDDIEL